MQRPWCTARAGYANCAVVNDDVGAMGDVFPRWTRPIWYHLWIIDRRTRICSPLQGHPVDSSLDSEFSIRNRFSGENFPQLFSWFIRCEIVYPFYSLRWSGTTNDLVGLAMVVAARRPCFVNNIVFRFPLPLFFTAQRVFGRAILASPFRSGGWKSKEIDLSFFFLRKQRT